MRNLRNAHKRHQYRCRDFNLLGNLPEHAAMKNAFYWFYWISLVRFSEIASKCTPPWSASLILYSYQSFVQYQYLKKMLSQTNCWLRNTSFFTAGGSRNCILSSIYAFLHLVFIWGISSIISTKNETELRQCCFVLLYGGNNFFLFKNYLASVN